MIPQFSVVIPLYNKEPHIKRAINSVINQTVTDFEVIVVDDGSTDEGAKIVSTFGDPRIHLIQQRNSGVSAARNRGAREGKSRFIAFLDADDEWASNYLNKILKLIEEFPSAGLYGTAYKDEFGNVCGNLSKTSEFQNLVPTEGLVPNYFQIANKGYYIFCASSVAAPKEVLLELGGFREDFWWGEDEDMWGRIALKYPIAYSSQVCSIYHQNVVNSTSRGKKPVKSHPFINSAREYISGGNVPAEILDDVKELIKYNEVLAAKHNMLVCGDYDLALKILIRKDIMLFNRKQIIRSLLSSIIRNKFSSLDKVIIYFSRIPR